MGQGSSSQREGQNSTHLEPRQFTQPGSDRVGGATSNIRPHRSIHAHSDQALPTRSRRQPQPPEVQSSQPFATFSRQISAQSVPVRGNLGDGEQMSARDEIFYEQQEIRPLVHMEDLGMRNGPITHITASPMPRRHSILSRLSSRIVPRYTTQGTSSNSHEEYTEGRPVRPRLATRLSSPPNTHETPDHRFSFRRPLSTSFATLARPRRQRDLASISRPFPLIADGSLRSPNFALSSSQVAPSEDTPAFDPTNHMPQPTPLSRRASRLSRLHRSLFFPFDFSSTARNNTSQGRDVQPSPRRPSRGSPADTAEYLLPPLSATDHNIELSNSINESNHSANRDHRSQVFLPLTESHRAALEWADAPSATERRAERGSWGRSETRRMPNLRGRSSRLIRRDDEGPLPRILHLAATAIAAQLSGTPDQAVTNMQAIGADGLDGSLNALFRTLQQATNSTGDMRTTERESDTNRSSGTLPPLNFLRVFRFVNPSSDRGRAPRSRPEEEESQPSRGVDGSDGSDGRTVTLVVVGVRSVPSERLENEDASVAEPSLDTLLSLPVTASANPARNGTGGLLRHVDGRSRFPQRRRASMGGLATFPTNFENQRHRMLSSIRQSSADATTATGPSNVALSLPESPPGPHPPPSTPAEPGLSAYSSGTTTPNQRPSSASAAQRPLLSNHDNTRRTSREVSMLAAGDDTIRVVQQRRRSDSEFARHRDLGAGAARRNGVVEPDQIENDDPPAHGSRSWLIYVVGTNLSEDHPAFATPSLFTDVRILG